MNYRIYWINFDYYSQEEFTSFSIAYTYAKSRGFQFRIDLFEGNQLFKNNVEGD